MWVLAGVVLLLAGCTGQNPVAGGGNPPTPVLAPTAAAPLRLPAPPPGVAPARPISDTAALLAATVKPARDLRALAMRLRPGVTNVPLVVNATPPSYRVGDTARFWTLNEDTQVHTLITATLVYETPHVYMWVEQGVSLDPAALKQSGDVFETKTYPTDRQYFGSEWTPGVDNDVHLSILHARALGRGIAGYFSEDDEYSHLVMPYSNEREMFYISVDSGGPVPGTSFYDGVLAHEFQHMIHWANHRNEDSWVNEGMSDLAMHLNGYDTGRPDILYASLPNTQLDTWADPTADPNQDIQHYGASYLFMDYFLGRFGAGLMKARVADQQDSIAGFDDVLAKAGLQERFNAIYADWLVANLVNQSQAAPHNRFGYPDITPPPPALMQSYQSLPAQGSGRVNQYGADYFDLKPGGPITVTFSGQPTVPFVGAQPDGKFAWYSNRGDSDDTTLTRSLDLRQATSATLTFSAWYNLEDGWDYSYVEVSTDGGSHFQILPGLHTRATDKVGNAYGPGWTGNSGGGGVPAWVDERVDLNAFAGKQVLLRFETITDDAYNGQGFLLDDISIPQIGFQDGGENGPNGWEAAGWLLTDNTLAEHWLVEAVARGQDGLEVQQMAVNANGQGVLRLPDAGSYSDVTLIVSPLAPVTTEPAAYSYQVLSAGR